MDSKPSERERVFPALRWTTGKSPAALLVEIGEPILDRLGAAAVAAPFAFAVVAVVVPVAAAG